VLPADAVLHCPDAPVKTGMTLSELLVARLMAACRECRNSSKSFTAQHVGRLRSAITCRSPTAAPGSEQRRGSRVESATRVDSEKTKL
jgi:hypothetical protein